MDVYKGIRSIALRRGLDAMSIYYKERYAASRRKKLKLFEPPIPGLTFVFHGLIQIDCEHFAIDFLTRQTITNSENYDIILQIAPRLPQNYIVRNSRLMGKWGPEENSSNLHFPLKRGKYFWIQVLLTEESFYISVNGFHFTKYNYRMPYKWLKAIEVSGDVTDVIIESFYVKEYPVRLVRSFNIDLSYTSTWSKDFHTIPAEWLRIDIPSKFLKHVSSPQVQLTLPFYGRIPEEEKLTDGRALRIEGRVRLMPQSFSVALQRGFCIWPQPTVSLLFRPSFVRNSHVKVGKAIITRSAFINGAWVNREVSRLHTHLRPGKAFVIVIACRKQCYELFVNSKLLLAFKHQMNPADVDIVNIRGDVKLWNIVVESAKVPQRKSGRSIMGHISRIRLNDNE
ncbi:galectin-6 isoform X1 [Drosophila sulfurigaster albostrigata]|uniref:galectin-6 isoform X1 n=1 Tax=Drosophila sulfurigaster albostrigata TaxID=89887 RepID=UPI002D21E938|nr:galectin-6 isoform X1 [Drosophila sulfurigaster albostrigata]